MFVHNSVLKIHIVYASFFPESKEEHVYNKSKGKEKIQQKTRDILSKLMKEDLAFYHFIVQKLYKITNALHQNQLKYKHYSPTVRSNESFPQSKLNITTPSAKLDLLKKLGYNPRSCLSHTCVHTLDNI